VQDEKGWKTEGYVQAGTDPMLSYCMTLIFYFVFTSVTGSFTSALSCFERYSQFNFGEMYKRTL